MIEPTQANPGPMYAGKKPVRDPLYLKFIRQLPCLVCLTRWFIHACHTGPHGTGQKSCDYSTIPLCRRHHREFDRAPRKFAERYKLDIPALIQMFNSFYRTKVERKKAA
jgi:hypothetical protein